MALQRRIRRALHHPATEVVVAALLAVDVQDGSDPHEALKVNPPADLVLAADHVLLVATSEPEGF
jgi:3',5'-cyclic AMP phosphodiesterase CpdA